jgi:hypothetical protein
MSLPHFQAARGGNMARKKKLGMSKNSIVPSGGAQGNHGNPAEIKEPIILMLTKSTLYEEAKEKVNQDHKKKELDDANQLKDRIKNAKLEKEVIKQQKKLASNSNTNKEYLLTIAKYFEKAIATGKKQMAWLPEDTETQINAATNLCNKILLNYQKRKVKKTTKDLIALAILLQKILPISLENQLNEAQRNAEKFLPKTTVFLLTQNGKATLQEYAKKFKESASPMLRAAKEIKKELTEHLKENIEQNGPDATVPSESMRKLDNFIEQSENHARVVDIRRKIERDLSDLKSRQDSQSSFFKSLFKKTTKVTQPGAVFLYSYETLERKKKAYFNSKKYKAVWELVNVKNGILRLPKIEEKIQLAEIEMNKIKHSTNQSAEAKSSIIETQASKKFPGVELETREKLKSALESLKKEIGDWFEKAIRKVLDTRFLTEGIAAFNKEEKTEGLSNQREFFNKHLVAQKATQFAEKIATISKQIDYLIAHQTEVSENEEISEMWSRRRPVISNVNNAPTKVSRSDSLRSNSGSIASNNSWGHDSDSIGSLSTSSITDSLNKNQNHNRNITIADIDISFDQSPHVPPPTENANPSKQHSGQKSQILTPGRTFSSRKTHLPPIKEGRKSLDGPDDASSPVNNITTKKNRF